MIVLVKRLQIFISRAIAYIYVFCLFTLKRFNNRRTVDNREMLLFLAGHIGDSLMYIDAVLEIGRVYVHEKNYKVFIICSKYVWNFCNIIADMSDFIFLDIDYYSSGQAQNWIGIKNVHRIFRVLKGRDFEKIIVNTWNEPIAHYIVSYLTANESILVVDDVEHMRKWRWYFERAYTKRIKVPASMHYMRRLQLILHNLDIIDYQVKTYHVAKLCEYQPLNKPYITIALDSLVNARRWSAHHFAELANRLLEIYPYDICFTGGTDAIVVYKECELLIKQVERIHNYTAKTTVKEWFELLRGAQFHIGVDSGSIHVASAVGTLSVCLAGMWDDTRCMPYDVDVLTQGTVLPTVVYRSDIEQLNCRACKVKSGRFGYGNPECYAVCQAGEPCLCLQRISVDDVIRTVSSVIATDKVEII